MKVRIGLPATSARSPYGPGGPVVPVLTMLPLASGVPFVGRTCRPVKVSTHGAVEGLVIVAVAVAGTTTTEAARPAHPAPLATAAPEPALNMNPDGTAMMIVPPFARSPAAAFGDDGPRQRRERAARGSVG